jgi:serine protease Do
MSTRKTTFFYAVLIAVASLAVGMVLASRLGLSPESSAQSMPVPPANSAPLTGPVDATTFRNIAKAATPSVVNIRTESRRRTQELTDYFGGQDPLQRFFGTPPGGGQGRQQPREETMQAAGTGFIISRDGLILTNNHVVEGATKIAVSFASEPDVEFDAKLIGRDQLTDSALIQLVGKPAAPLAEARFGDSSLMQPGDWVMAIGNPFGLDHTVTVGVISGIERSLTVTEGRNQEVIQTDAAINRAIPADPAQHPWRSHQDQHGNPEQRPPVRQSGDRVRRSHQHCPRPAAACMGKVTRGRIAVQVGIVPADNLADLGLKERRGAQVSSVEAGGPAAKAGMQPGDIILDFNGQPVKSRDDLVRIVMGTKPGTTVPVKIMRDKRRRRSTSRRGLDLEAESSGRRSGESAPQESSAGLAYPSRISRLQWRGAWAPLRHAGRHRDRSGRRRRGDAGGADPRGYHSSGQPDAGGVCRGCRPDPLEGPVRRSGVLPRLAAGPGGLLERAEGIAPEWPPTAGRSSSSASESAGS